LQLERSSVILLHRPAHPLFDGLLHSYGPHLSSLFAHPEPASPEQRARQRISRCVSNWPSSTEKFTGCSCVDGIDSSGRLSQLWKNWWEVLIIVKPETVIKWHRQGFRLYWRWKSKAPVGRPKIDKEIRELIGKMSRENPLWGVPRLQAELHLLGYDLAESTVAKYRARGRNISVANLEDLSCQSCEADCDR